MISEDSNCPSMATLYGNESGSVRRSLVARRGSSEYIQLLHDDNADAVKLTAIEHDTKNRRASSGALPPVGISWASVTSTPANSADYRSRLR